MNKKYISACISLAAVASLALALPASAQTLSASGSVGVGIGAQVHGPWQNQDQNEGQAQAGEQGDDQGQVQAHGDAFAHAGDPMRPVVKPAVFGTVSAISGDTLTVTSKPGLGYGRATSTIPAASVVYSVDATNATVTKNNATSSVSAIAVGDTVVVQGTVTGTNVIATTIRDGLVPMRGGKGGYGMHPGMASTTPAFSGNGEPVVAGNVSSINGSSVTITNKSNVTYTIDASNAKIVEGQDSTASVSNIAVGDSLVVQGAVNGNAVIATTIIDQTHPNATSTPKKGMLGGFFGGIGAFFSHLFGF